MANDWIPIRVNLDEEPEVIFISEQTGTKPEAVVGHLVKLWGWFDQHTTDGHAVGVTLKWIDRYLHWNGFAELLVKVGWMDRTEDGIAMPGYDHWLSQSGKRRALANKRQKRKRAKKPVTQVSRKCHAPSVTTEHDMTEHIPKESKPKKEKRFVPPTTAEVAAYCQERGNGIDAAAFVAHYEAGGWMRGKTKIKDWRACVRTWEGQKKKTGGNGLDLVGLVKGGE